MFSLLQDLSWPLALLVGWIAGEILHARASLPRISTYAMVGFALGLMQSDRTELATPDLALLLANLALGLLLFEAGYRINLLWLKKNMGLLWAMLTETCLTFAGVYAVALIWGQDSTTALLLAALCMATSPATVVRVMFEMKSSGQLSERMMHHAVFSSILAVLTFKIIVGWVAFESSGSLLEATYSSLFVLVASAGIGVAMGVFMPALLRITQRAHRDSTLAFSMAIIFLVVLTHGLKLSPILATLTFGVMARHNRIMINPSQSGFGVLGDLLSVFLFIFVASKLEWSLVLSGMALGLALVLTRLVAKMAGHVMWARYSGISLKKGALVGLAGAPLSAFVILVLEQTRYHGISLMEQLAPLAAAALVLEILGPMWVQRAVLWAGEAPEHGGSKDAA